MGHSQILESQHLWNRRFIQIHFALAISRALQVKKDRLFGLKPGAINPGEPKVIWVKMINQRKAQDDTLTVRRKFNTVLENLLVDYKHHYIMDLDYYLSEPAFFNANMKTAK